MFLTTLIAQAQPPNLPDIEEIDIPEPLPDPWKSLIWIGIGILIFIAVAAVVITIVLMLTREKKRTLTAEYVALKRLGEIEPRAPELTPNEFSIQVSVTLKDFVQSRFNDPVRFETTEEFLHRITEKPTIAITPQVRDQLADFLKIAEEIKFGLPPDAEARKMPLIQLAKEIIETQRRVMQAQANAKVKPPAKRGR